MRTRAGFARRTLLPLASLGLLAALLGGCAGHRRPTPKPGTGDVAFRLSWEGISDLDLMVRDPTGECIAYFARRAPSGGVLDVDCNGSYESTCDRPIENIFWPKAKAPAGEYIVWVQAHSIVPGGTRLPLRLQLLRGKEVFWSGEGELETNDGVYGPFVYRFPGDGGAAHYPGPFYPRPCGTYSFPGTATGEVRSSTELRPTPE